MKKLIIIFITFASITAILIYPLKPAKAAGAAGIVTLDIPRMVKWIYENVARSIMHAIIQNILNDIEKWAVSGFNGEPYFITDFEDTLWQASDRAAGELLQEIVATSDDNFCPNFKGMITGAAGGFSFFNIKRTYSEEAACTLTKELGMSPEELVNAVKTGNVPWNFYLASSLTNNDVFGLYWKTQADLATRQQQAVEADKLQYTVNKGFFDQKECAEWAEAGLPENQAGPVGKFCKKWIYKTPGQVIAKQLEKYTDVQYDWLISANDIGELTDAFLTGILQRLSSNTGLINKYTANTDFYSAPEYSSLRPNPKTFEKQREKSRENIFKTMQEFRGSALFQKDEMEKTEIAEILTNVVENNTEILFQAKTNKLIAYDKSEELRHYNPEYDICTYLTETLQNIKDGLEKYPVIKMEVFGVNIYFTTEDFKQSLNKTHSPLYSLCIGKFDEDEGDGDKPRWCLPEGEVKHSGKYRGAVKDAKARVINDPANADLMADKHTESNVTKFTGLVIKDLQDHNPSLTVGWWNYCCKGKGGGDKLVIGNKNQDEQAEAYDIALGATPPDPNCVMQRAACNKTCGPEPQSCSDGGQALTFSYIPWGQVCEASGQDGSCTPSKNPKCEKY